MQCVVEGCDQKSVAQGFCNKHYIRWRKFGDPNLCLKEKAPNREPLKYLNEVILLYQDNECLLWTYGRNSNGYGEVIIDGKNTAVHVVVCEKINGPKPSPDHVASHKCGNGHLGCLTPKHLKWQTRIEDRTDMITHGTINRGSRNGRSILTEDNVQEIRSLNGKLTQREIARKFGISQPTVSQILKGDTWS